MRPRLRIIGALMAIGVIAAAGCSGDDDASTATPTGPASSGVITIPGSTTPGTTTTTPAGTSVAPPTTPIPTTTTTTTTTTVPATTTTVTGPKVDVKVYLVRVDRLAIEHREVAGPAVLRAALDALVSGPTADDTAAGLGTAVPAGTTIRSVNLEGGLATVDLSREFATGGGTLSMSARVAQIVFTATQFPNVDRVMFWMEGEPIEALGGEGLVLDAPQTRAMVDRTLTGAVLVDTPQPGDSVGNPIRVTGEADVFEAQFPIEIWRDGVQIGGMAPVTGGANGTWGAFDVSITLDAPAGPIQLVTYDEGGCGDDPECPEIVKTVVDLTFTG